MILASFSLLGTAAISFYYSLARVTSIGFQLILFLALFSLGSTPATAVIVDGKDWRQLTATNGFSWNQVSTVCPAGGGICSGSLGTTDFTGWIWATVFEVGELFKLLTPHPGGVVLYEELNSSWAPAIFDLFTPTFSDIGSTRLTGLSATTVPLRSDLAYAPEIMDRPVLFPDLPDNANTANVRGVDLVGAVDQPGVWLYRVPEPTTVMLLGLGLAGLGFSRRRLH